VNRHLLALAMCATLTLAAAPAFAQKAGSSDVTLIDQSKALNGNVTAGDVAGFPVAINQPGSYKLTSNLVVPAGISGIVVQASDVTIDLNGFAIKGPGYCSGWPGPVTCSAAGGASGISQGVDNHRRLAIMNGSVGGFTLCFESRYQSRLADVTAHDFETGIVAFEGSLVTRAIVGNSKYGIVAYGASVDGASVTYADIAAYGHSSIVRGLAVTAAHTGVAHLAGNPPIGVRESVLQAGTPFSGATSLGNNLCNAGFC